MDLEQWETTTYSPPGGPGWRGFDVKGNPGGLVQRVAGDLLQLRKSNRDGLGWRPTDPTMQKIVAKIPTRGEDQQAAVLSSLSFPLEYKRPNPIWVSEQIRQKISADPKSSARAQRLAARNAKMATTQAVNSSEPVIPVDGEAEMNAEEQAVADAQVDDAMDALTSAMGKSGFSGGRRRKTRRGRKVRRSRRRSTRA
jgi:hypothetical protein